MKIQSKSGPQLTLVDSGGHQLLVNTLLTFRSPDLRKSYLLCYPTSETGRHDLGIRAYRLPEGSDPTTPECGDELRLVKTRQEWNVIKSVLNTFLKPDD